MTDQGKLVFPVVHSLEGRPTDDGTVTARRSHGLRRERAPLRHSGRQRQALHRISVAVGRDDQRGPGGQGDSGAAHVGEGSLPIPATSIAIGEPNGNEGYIGISVGRAELIFSMPVSAFGELGQSLLMAGATSPAMPS